MVLQARVTVPDSSSPPDGASEPRRGPDPEPAPPPPTGGPDAPTGPFGWLFRSRRTGKITIVQFPNVALWIFLVTVVLRRVVPRQGVARTALDAIAAAALAWWALDEVFRGVNPWRRMLGLAGCALVAAGVVSSLS
jgi:hypothetical protein